LVKLHEDIYNIFRWNEESQVALKSTIFWDMTPCSLLSFNRRFGGTYRLHPETQWTTRRYIPEDGNISSIFRMEMEAICSSETSVETQRTTRRHIPEDGTLHNHRCENLKSYKLLCLWNTFLVVYEPIYYIDCRYNLYFRVFS
jgi:hypothetical protein